MPLSPTVPSAILADFRTQIEAITPAETEKASKTFVFKIGKNDVESGEVRTFTLAAKLLGDGTIVSCGNDFEFRLEVWTSYRDLQPFHAYPLIIEDSRQIWQTLYLRADPTLTGLMSVMWDGPFEFENEDDGEIWGFHPFRVRYIADDDP